MTTVQFRAVTKQFAQTVAVERFDLEVADGELVTLLGPSGCGKTTTLRMTAGLIEPTDGRILFDERDVTHLPPRKRNIGFVFQVPALFPHLSVADNIGFGLSVKGRPKGAIAERVAEMLALVDLGGLGGRAPAQLSGGQQQRVALARVLATDPTVLLFDEPLSALDKNLRDTLKYSILDLQRKTRKTAIYVTHDQSEAFAISDRVVVMNAGRIEQIGTQTEIYLHPKTRFVAEFIGANNGLEGTVAGRDPDDDGVVLVSVGALTVRCRHPDPIAVGAPAIAYVRPENIVVLGDGEDRHRNVVEGVVDRVIFEGATAQVRVDIGGRELRADVSGEQRLMLDAGTRRVRLGFDDATLIPISAADAADESRQDGTEPAIDAR